MRFLLLTLIFILSACSYQFSYPSMDGVKTVSVAKFTNLSEEPRLAIMMMEKLKERIRQDGTYRLIDNGEADLVISGQIKSVDQLTAGAIRQKDTDGRKEDSDRAYRADLYSARLKVNVQVINRKGETVYTDDHQDQALFAENIDQGIERRQALARAAYSLASQIVEQISSGAW